MEDDLKRSVKKLAVTSLMTGVAAMGMVATTPSAEAGVTRSFLKIANLPGESADAKHKGEIDVISYSQSLGYDKDGRYECATFTITKHVDLASPRLAVHAATGTPAQQMLLSVRKEGGKTQQDFYRLDLRDVSVVNISGGGSSTGADIPLETLTLRAKSATIEYSPSRSDGSVGAPVKESITCPQPVKAR